MTSELPKLVNFILPSGNIHLSRAIARRCERRLFKLISNHNSTIAKHIDNNCIKFINRLSYYYKKELMKIFIKNQQF